MASTPARGRVKQQRRCRRCIHDDVRGKRRVRANALDERNPQNVGEPNPRPHAELSAEDVVRIHMDAFMNMNNPWPDHGVHLAYAFALGVGGMERVRYFNGLSKDLYHLDHFLNSFKTILPELLSLERYEILLPAEDNAAGDADAAVFDVDVYARARGDLATRYRFSMRRGRMGRTAGSMLVERIDRTPPP